MSKFNLNLFNNSKTILINQNKIFDLIIDDIDSKNKNLKSQSKILTERITSIEEERKAMQKEYQKITQNEITKEKDDELFKLIDKNKSLEKEQKTLDEKNDKIGDLKTWFEQFMLEYQNLKRKSKQIIESIESKIESPDEDETTDDEIKKELTKLNSQLKLISDKYQHQITSNYIDQFINNKYEINGIVFENK